MAPQDDLAELLADLPQIKADIAFVRAMRQLTIITVSGEIHIQLAQNTENVVIDLRSITASGETPPNQLPAQSGHAGAALITDGSTVSWS